MNKEKFLHDLEKALKPLPIEERQSALEYYTELFAESENEYELIASLPTPKQIAATLIIEFGSQSGEKSSTLPIATIILAICSAPIAIPIAVALFAVLLALVIVLFCLVVIVPLSVLIAFISVAIAGVVAVVPAYSHNFATGLYFTGMVLAGVGFFALLGSGWLKLVKAVFSGIKLFVLRLVGKGVKK